MMSRTLPDRSVHAHDDLGEIVRYDVSGKWWWEPRGDGMRVPMKVRAAALFAVDTGMEICENAPGGSAFMRAAKARA